MMKVHIMVLRQPMANGQVPRVHDAYGTNGFCTVALENMGGDLSDAAPGRAVFAAFVAAGVAVFALL